MTYQSKLEKVRALLEEHNGVVGDGSKVNIDLTLTKVKNLGGTNEEALKEFSFEDVEQCLTPARLGGVAMAGAGGVWEQGAPKILAKSIAKIFRGTDFPVSAPVETYVSDKKAKRMSPRELVEAYDPTDPTSAVAERLNEISKGKPFIVFESGRKVDIGTTLKLLEEIKLGYESRDRIKVGDNYFAVHKVGFVPNNFADENPVFHGRPLRPDGTCDQINRSWEGISTKLRQLVYLAVKSGEIKAHRNSANDLLDCLLEPNAEQWFKDHYQEATLKWDSLNEVGNLPNLKIPIGIFASVIPSDFPPPAPSPLNKGTPVAPPKRDERHRVAAIGKNLDWYYDQTLRSYQCNK